MQVKLSKKHIKSRWEEDYQLVDNEGLFEEYLEMGMVIIIILIHSCVFLYAISTRFVGCCDNKIMLSGLKYC